MPRLSTRGRRLVGPSGLPWRIGNVVWVVHVAMKRASDSSVSEHHQVIAVRMPRSTSAPVVLELISCVGRSSVGRRLVVGRSSVASRRSVVGRSSVSRVVVCGSHVGPLAVVGQCVGPSSVVCRLCVGRPSVACRPSVIGWSPATRQSSRLSAAAR